MADWCEWGCDKQIDALEAERDRLLTALAELLRLAEREHGGGFFRPEDWYAARDQARLLTSGPVSEKGDE